MKNTFGSNVQITIFGESHGKAIGAVLDGMPAGIPVDEDFIRHQLNLRKPSGQISTSRREDDDFIIESGVFKGFTTGTPICILIENKDTKSGDYKEIKDIARPGHADYAAYCKYRGFGDYRGGGHFSGRITAALVACGAVCLNALADKKITIGTHIKKCAGIDDREFEDLFKDTAMLNNSEFPVLDSDAGEKMKEAILEAKKEGDSVGGVLETAVLGLPAGLGEPWFDSFEGVLAHGLFSIPAIKGVEFGKGFEICDMRGSMANDPFRMKDGKIVTSTNNNGGINGGITNGMPVIFRCGVKPVPTIAKTQETVNFKLGEDTTISARGRHDPSIVHRARVVVDSMAAFAVCDMLASNYGDGWYIRSFQEE